MSRRRISEWLQPAYRNPLSLMQDRQFNDSISIDAPSTTANYLYLLGALRSRAPGQWSSNVLTLTQNFTSSIFLAVNTMSNQMASTEMKIMERTGDVQAGDVQLEHTEPAVRFFEEPNDEDSWGAFSYSISQQMGLTGMSLIWLPQLDENETPSEMYVLPTASCLPWPPSPVYPHGSYLVQPLKDRGPQLAMVV
jgi:hypothetical protein